MKEFENEIGVTPVDLMEVWPDLKRVLRVQIKELLHTIEDVEFASAAETPVAAAPATIVKKPPSSQSHVA